MTNIINTGDEKRFRTDNIIFTKSYIRRATADPSKDLLTDKNKQTLSQIRFETQELGLASMEIVRRLA